MPTHSRTPERNDGRADGRHDMRKVGSLGWVRSEEMLMLCRLQAI